MHLSKKEEKNIRDLFSELVELPFPRYLIPHIFPINHIADSGGLTYYKIDTTTSCEGVDNGFR